MEALLLVIALALVVTGCQRATAQPVPRDAVAATPLATAGVTFLPADGREDAARMIGRFRGCEPVAQHFARYGTDYERAWAECPHSSWLLWAAAHLRMDIGEDVYERIAVELASMAGGGRADSEAVANAALRREQAVPAIDERALVAAETTVTMAELRGGKLGRASAVARLAAFVERATGEDRARAVILRETAGMTITLGVSK